LDFTEDPDHDALRAGIRAVCADFDDGYWSACDGDHRFPWEFTRAMGDAGWIGLTIPEELGGGGCGITEAALLMREVAASGAAMNGCSAIHLTVFGLEPVVRFGNDRLRRTFLPRAATGDLHVAFGVTEPTAGTDTSKVATRAVRDGDGWRLNGQKTWTTSAHFAEWYWVGARTDPDAPKHSGITLFLVPLDHPGITINGIWTMGDERTNDVFFDDVWVSDDYVVGDVNRGFQYISEALDLERFTMFTFSPIQQRLELLCEHVATETRDGEPLRADPVIRRQVAHLVTEAEVARVLGLRFVAASMKGGAPPTTEASEYKLFATELSKRLADASMDVGGPGSQLRVRTDDAPMKGRAESTYRYTVIDTIGGGTSEVQKNIISRRKLGLPKNF